MRSIDEENADTDVLTPKQRSYCMSRIRGKDTKPEILLRKAVWSMGLRYRLKPRMTGNPDFYFPKPKVAVFVDGCFWHGCPEHWTKPKKNVGFWETKIQKNTARDRLVNDELNRHGWTVIRVWEHEIKSDTKQVAERVVSLVRSLLA